MIFFSCLFFFISNCFLLSLLHESLMNVWIIESPHALHDCIDSEEAKPFVHVFTSLIPSEPVPLSATVDCTRNLVFVCLVPKTARVRQTRDKQTEFPSCDRFSIHHDCLCWHVKANTPPIESGAKGLADGLHKSFFQCPQNCNSPNDSLPI